MQSGSGTGKQGTRWFGLESVVLVLVLVVSSVFASEYEYEYEQ